MGTFCGKRAITLALLSFVAAVAPAVASADTSLGGIASAVPSASTAPAAPSVSTPAALPVPVVPSVPAPAAPTPALATPAIVVDPAAPSASLSTPIATATISKGHSEVKPTASVSDTVAKAKASVTGAVAKVIASHKVTKAAAARVSKAQNKQVTVENKTTVDPTKKQVTVGKKLVLKMHMPNGRVLQWTSDDPHSGCLMSTWQICQSIPFQFNTVNDCKNSDGTNDAVSINGTLTTWTKTTVNLNGTITIRQRNFFIGFNGSGTPSLATYNGKDSQTDVQKTFVSGAFSDDNAEYEQLMVTNPGILQAQSEWMYVRTVFKVSATGGVVADTFGPYIVCQKFQRHHDDDHHGDGKGQKCDEHHHNEDYHGYNDDDNKWDD